jgi:hypothetical protein
MRTLAMTPSGRATAAAARSFVERPRELSTSAASAAISVYRGRADGMFWM